MHSPERVHLALQLHAEGLGATEIGRRLEIPRATVRDWLQGKVPISSREERCAACGAPEHDYYGLPSAYAQLLGLYLGDGCLSAHRRWVYRMRVSLDLKYPGIIRECAACMEKVQPGSKVLIQTRVQNCAEVSAYSKTWPCLFPQHGPGMKHTRRIELAAWQQHHVMRHPQLLLRGLIQSDGCRFENTGRGGWRNPRYSFSNVSDDIRRIFCDACDLLGLRWTEAPRTIYVSRKADVAKLDEFVGPKF